MEIYQTLVAVTLLALWVRHRARIENDGARVCALLFAISLIVLQASDVLRVLGVDAETLLATRSAIGTCCSTLFVLTVWLMLHRPEQTVTARLNRAHVTAREQASMIRTMSAQLEESRQ